jgi:GDP-fucose protein O-fucosyltransferase
MRQKAREHDPKGNPEGIFDSFHIRRGDFQYKDTRISAEEIYANTKDKLIANSTIFVATDERDKSFFDPLKKHYNLFFLDDFMHLLEGVNTNYYGMIDQLVASRGRVFHGCWFSTFTGFINRMRGYRSVKDKLPGHEDGVLPTSFYYTPTSRRDALQQYVPLSNSYFAREFPSSWRGIDKGIGMLPQSAA